LQQTLSGAIQTLSDVLSLAMPEAFGRATRIKRRAKALVEAVGIRDSWRIEVAAALSQLGAVTLRADTVSRLYHGQPLSDEERTAAARLPSIAVDLIKTIPRMQTVCELITQGFGSEHATGAPPSIEGQALRLCNDYDGLHTAGMSGEEALGTLRRRGFDAKLFEAFSALAAGENATGKLKDVTLIELRDGMVLAEDIYTTSGTLLLARGNTIRGNVIERLRAMRGQLGPRNTLRVRLPD
jgi:hypothetical protein